MTLTRDEFEEWLQQNADDVLDRMNQTPRTLNSWVTSYARTMAVVAAERGDDSDVEDIDGAFGGADDDGLFGGNEDY
jgi:hypothetical protein